MNLLSFAPFVIEIRNIKQAEVLSTFHPTFKWPMDHYIADRYECISEWCRLNNITSSQKLNQTAAGTRKQHKGMYAIYI